MALFHLIFELFKIAILSTVYSGGVLLVLRVIKHLNNTTYLDGIRFKRLYFSIYGILFVFSFTYFGDHGLGDEACLPLGHFEVMNSTDGYAYFTPAGTSEQISVDSFKVANGALCM